MKVALELFLVLASVEVVALLCWLRSWGVVVLLRSFRGLCFFCVGLVDDGSPVCLVVGSEGDL